MNTLRGLSFLSLAALMACSSAESDWKSADSAGTVASYQSFMNDHPNSSHAEQAKGRIQTLEDDGAWASAQKADTLDAYKQYTQSQPNGAHSADAGDHITAIERAAAWKVAQADGTATSLQSFLQKYPNGAEADQARSQLEKVAYRVELGTFKADKEAQRARARLQSRFGKVLHEVVVIPSATPEQGNRLASNPMSQADAKAACATLKKSHQSCEVVKS